MSKPMGWNPATRKFIHRNGVVELRPDDPDATVCGKCERGWDDTVSTAWTPTPAGRCPFEYEHEYDEYEDLTGCP